MLIYNINKLWILLKGQNMSKKIYALIALATCIGLLLTGFSAGQLESNVTLSIGGVIQHAQPSLSDGWENQSPPNYDDPTDNGAWTGFAANAPSAISVVKTTPYNGFYCLDLSGGGGGSEWAGVYKSLSTPQPILYVSAYLKFATVLPHNGEYLNIIEGKKSVASQTIARITVTNDSSGMYLMLMDYHGTTQAYTSVNYNFALNQWYNIQLYCSIDSNAGSCVVYVNGIPQISDSEINNAVYGNIGTVFLELSGNMNDGAHNIYVDNAVISTSQTVASSAGPSASVNTPINTADYEKYPTTSTNASFFANNFNMVYLNPYSYIDSGISLAQTIKTQNPSEKVLFIWGLSYAYSSQADWSTINSNPSWFVHYELFSWLVSYEHIQLWMADSLGFKSQFITRQFWL